MANFSTNPIPDYIFNSATLRSLPPEFIGNSHWDYALQNDRLKCFLLRNMTRAWTVHQKRSAEHAQSAQKPQQAQTDLAPLVGEGLKAEANEVFAAIQVNEVARRINSKLAAVTEVLPEHDTSISALESMSRQTLLVKHKSDTYNSTQRKSLRTILQKQHEDPTASLIIAISNIRKRLNWKESKTTQEPPRKRPRLEPIECDVHLAIWDNSDSAAVRLPIVSKREFCELVKVNRDSDTASGDVVELKLDGPFIVSQKDLRVPAKNGKDRMALADNYFMEIKITPRDENVVWPPIPMLGKSDGERFSGMGTDAKNEICTSLIARYQRLPDAPEPDTPLAVFVYAEGRTFRTKYGLEVSAKWVPKDHPALIQKPIPESDLEPWALDDDRKPFGRADPNRKPVSHAARKTVQAGKKVAPRAPKQPSITYSFQVPRGAKKGFNTCLVNGLQCYTCSGKIFQSLVELRFHLDQIHKNRVTVENVVLDPENSRLLAATIKIETPSNLRLKTIQGDQDDEVDKSLHFVASSVPFDLDAHYNGKSSPWTEALPAQLSKEAARGPLTVSTAIDSQSILRREHKGHVPYQHVLPFRPQEYQRKKYPVKKLLTKHASLANPYTSISHRPIPSGIIEEDARSETDDEIDDNWFVTRHLEEIDIHSRQEEWPDARRRLAKKWDWHILHRERGISAKYMSDCLIRFVRMEKKWILREHLSCDDPEALLEAQTESISALMETMAELKNMKVINESVCTDVVSMLYSEEELVIPMEEQKEIEDQAAFLTKYKIRQTEQESIYQESSDASLQITMLESISLSTCAGCLLPIENDNQRAVRCSNLGCSAPNLWYHAKCAGMPIFEDNPAEDFEATSAALTREFMHARLKWKCNRCTVNKGKDKANPPIPNMTRTSSPVGQQRPTPDASKIEDESSVVQDVTAAEDTESRSASSSVAPSMKSISYLPHTDVQAALRSRVIYHSSYIDDRRSLRGIVLHHYHMWNEGCMYAVTDERPNRSRSKKSLPILAMIQRNRTTSSLSGKQYLVRFPDPSRKRDSERWWFLDRSIEAEIIARFRPYKIQHYVRAQECFDAWSGLCRCPLEDLSRADKDCLQHNVKDRDECRYGRDTLTKEPGRGFYMNEQDNPGTVWHGDYFDALQTMYDTEQKVVCKEESHSLCKHSVTIRGSKYKGFVKVDREPWYW